MSQDENRPAVRTALEVPAIKQSIIDNLACVQGKFPAVANRHDFYMALARTVRDRIMHRWSNTARTYFKKASRTVAYLSAEYLLGPHLGNNLVNLNIYEPVEAAVRELGLALNDILEQEEEPGLGNGGLGRLAACFLESLATLGIPSIGYGIRYEFGIFDQEIRDGWQVEVTDKWLRWGNPWEVPRPDISFPVRFGGTTEKYADEHGRFRVRWTPDRLVRGVAYDTPIVGYRTNTANLLRLFAAEATESFDFRSFNVGDYYGAVHEKLTSENLTKVLYPNDEPQAGKQLRLEQQYFFTSCALQDMIRVFLQREQDLRRFSSKYAVQLNDTHPAIGVAELMRLLVDEHDLGWEDAWKVTQETFSYTNHTLLPEALEKWPIELFGKVLPRHLDIIYEINRRFMDEVRGRYPGEPERLGAMSLIDESGTRFVRMAHLAAVGSHAINGVARLHTKLLCEQVMRPFHDLWPERFSNKTNGVTPRRFLLLSNPGLARLITSRIGDGWVRDLAKLRELEAHAKDPGFRSDWRRVKLDAKRALADILKARTGIAVNPESLFDIQVKRIHEYKRQHLAALHAIALYLRLKRGSKREAVPRTIIFGGKAAPGYFMAKLIIKLINEVGRVVNADPDTRDLLRVVFLPDFNVKVAQHVYPAADLSEQISTAGKEASGTGNMKFAMNGALTIGTLDGANIEIREEVGAENFFLFGLTFEQVETVRRNNYHPADVLRSVPELPEVLQALSEGRFSNGDSELFRPLVDSILQRDEYMLVADFMSYSEAQTEASRAFLNLEHWAEMSILNTARIGKFSSDRAILEYCGDIWRVASVSVE